MANTLIVAALGVPPVLHAPAILLGNLLRKFPLKSYHILMGHLNKIWVLKDMNSQLPAEYTFANFPMFDMSGNWFRKIYKIMKVISAIIEILIKGLIIIRKERISSIFVVQDHYVELAAILMKWITKKKVVLWLTDLYCVPELVNVLWDQKLNGILELWLLKAVDKVLVCNEATQKYYLDKYEINTEIMRHSVEIEKYKNMEILNKHSDQVEIVFTGSFTNSQEGGILDLVKILNENPDLNIKFMIYTNERLNYVKKCGIAGPNVKCNIANRSVIPSIQRSADILFLPLSFTTQGYNHHSIVRTASPSKLTEYLVAGVPILIYAPDYSYYVTYAKQEGFGLVVEKPDRELLLKGLKELINNSELRTQLTVNAQRVAREYHDSNKISLQLQELLGVNQI